MRNIIKPPLEPPNESRLCLFYRNRISFLGFISKISAYLIMFTASNVKFPTQIYEFPLILTRYLPPILVQSKKLLSYSTEKTTGILRCENLCY
jgi:hypothetical protein